VGTQSSVGSQGRAGVVDGSRDRRRYLVALLLEGPVADEVRGLRRAVTGMEAPMGPHLTLVPPRNLGHGQLAGVLDLVRGAAAASAPLQLELGPPATFPGTSQVLYLGVGGDLSGLGQLRMALLQPPLEVPPLEGSSSGATPAREPHPFVPHVSVAGRLEPTRATQLAVLLGAYRASVTCCSVSLAEEVVSPSGRRWSVIAGEALGGRSVRGRGGLEVELSLADRLDPVTSELVAKEWAAYGRSTYGDGWHPDRPFVLVARRQGALAGAAMAEQMGEVCELGRLIVVAGERGLGTGSRLLEGVVRHAGELGCGRVRLRTLAGGPAATFYEARGFRVTCCLGAWREGRDFVVMERRLS